MANDILNGQIVVEHDLPDEFYWIKVAMPCRSKNNDFYVGKHALCQDPGYVEYVGTDEKRGVLLRYRTNKSAAGTSAPDGAVFFVSQDEYDKFLPRGAAKLRQIEKDNIVNDAARLLKRSQSMKW